MKKYLLGALFILSAAAFAGSNSQVKEKFDSNGNAKAMVPVSVRGQVLRPINKSLVIDITSGESETGPGFDLHMGDLIAGENNKLEHRGKFSAKVLIGSDIHQFTNEPTVTLVRNGVEVGQNEVIENTGASFISGAADDVKLTYNLTGKLAGNRTAYEGEIFVTAKAGSKTGTYVDNSVQLKVEVEGQEL